MNVPLLDLNAQLAAIESELQDALMETLKSTRYILGPKVEEFESNIADYVGATHAIGVSSGTDALLVALMALEIGPGDTVITTPFSFFATAGSVVRLGATPVFVDIDPDTYNLSPAGLQAWIEANPAEIDSVKAIMPVHLYGQCADMEAIGAIAQEHGIPIVEDAAQAIGATCEADGNTRSAGSMGLAGCFSFFPSKNLGGLGDGGMVVTNDDAFAEKIRMLRNHGAKPKYYHAVVGGNFRLDAIQAAVLDVKLKYLDEWHAGRKENADYYNAQFTSDALTKPLEAAATVRHVYNQYVLSVREDRDGLRSHLGEASIGSEIYYPLPFHLQECFAPLGYKQGDFPASEHAAEHTIALPIYSELTDGMQDYVVRTVESFYD